MTNTRRMLVAAGVVCALATVAPATPVTSGLTLWLDGDDAAFRNVVGGEVQSWTSKAPSVNGSAPAVTALPTGGTDAAETPNLVVGGLNGRDYVNFESPFSGDLEDLTTATPASSFFSSTGRTFVAVMRPDAPSAASASYFSPQIMGEHNGYWAITYRDFGGQQKWAHYNWDVNEDNATHPLTLGQFAIVVGTLSAGQLDIYVNGSPGAGLASGATGNMSNTLRIGHTDFFNAGIAELMVYDHGLDLQDRQQVESYLSEKWGIALIPEPASLALLGAGGLLALKRRRCV